MWVFAVVALTIGIAVAIAVQLRARARRPALPETPPPLEAPPEEAVPEPLAPSGEQSRPIAELVDHAVLIHEDEIVASRYRVIGKLGSDELGPAFEVQRLADGQRFAMKTLRRRGANRMMRFAREAQSVAEIEHANLVPMIDLGFTDNELFIVMPLVHGGSLEQVRHRFGDPAWALPLLAQVASGLAALHARGLVHRGLRPSNVLLSRGTAKITDIGLAALSRKSDAPETVDATVDVLAFGELAREMLVGKQDAELPAWVTRCLDADPAARPTATELVSLIAA